MKRLSRLFCDCLALEPKTKRGDCGASPGSMDHGAHSCATATSRGGIEAVRPASDPAVHLSLVIDCSEKMQGAPLAAVGRGIAFLLRSLHPQDVLTIWLFDSCVARPVHCEAQHFRGQLRGLKKRGGLKNSDKDDKVWLYDAIIAAVEDLEAKGDRPAVIKPMLVITDGHEGYGSAEAFEAKNALLWCELPHLRPILVSTQDPDVFEEVKQTKSREVFVESRSDRDIFNAFLVAGEHLQAILKQQTDEILTKW